MLTRYGHVEVQAAVPHQSLILAVLFPIDKVFY
jgi:hypothetical protein